MVLTELGAVLFTLVLRYWTTRDRYVFSVFNDEASELAIARTLAGSRPFHAAGISFDAGYGTLVAPIYAFVKDPGLAFRVILIINVILALGTLLVVRALLLRLLDIPRPVATWSAAIALALPGAAMQTPYTAAEVLIVLVVALTLLLAVTLQSRGGWVPALGLATMGASVLLIHSRLTAVAAAVAVVLVVSSLLGEIPRRAAVTAVGVLSVLSWAALQYNSWVYEQVWLPFSPDSSRLPETLDRLTSPAAVGSSVAGMAWHQMVTTFGLVVVGVGVLLVTSVRRDRSPRIGLREWQRWKILLIIAAAAAPGAVLMADRRLAAQMVYGRYWDALAVPVVGIGIGYLLHVGFRRGIRAFSMAILVTGGTGAALFLTRQDSITAAFEEHGFGSPRRIAGLLAFVAPGDSINVGVITVTSLAAMVGVSAVMVLSRKHYQLMAVVVLMGLATAATVRASTHLNEYSLGQTKWEPAEDLVEAGIVPAGTTVAFQLDRKPYNLDPRMPFMAYQFYEPDVEFAGLKGADVLEYEWVVSDVADPMMAEQGWEMVFEHPDGGGVAVWTSP